MDNKFVPIIVVLLVVFFGFTFAKTLLVKQAAQEAAKIIQKEYCPSPYGPGVDPDKVDARKLPPLQ